MNNKLIYVVSAIIVSAGIFSAGFCIGKGIYLTRFLNKSITVKGLTERDVKSDLGIWEIDYREIGDNLGDLNKRLQNDQSQIIEFLKKRGFKPEEMALQPIKLEDKLANAYQANNTPAALAQRYILTAGIRVRTEQVDLIQAANQALGNLLELGISIVDSGSISPNPSYYYTKLDAIRPNMMADATKSARLVAEQFAKDSNIQLVGIQKASQGVFQIMGRDTSTLNTDWSSNQSAIGSIEKKIRLVTTIEYQIKSS